MNDKHLMDQAADNIRILAVSMVEKAKSGHPGGAMGGADFINFSSLSFSSLTQISLSGLDVTDSISTQVTCHQCSMQR